MDANACYSIWIDVKYVKTIATNDAEPVSCIPYSIQPKPSTSDYDYYDWWR